MIEDDAKPGTFEFEANDKGLFFMCPCGCGELGFVGFRGRSEPERPLWEWDGNRETPTLSPSIQRNTACRWHGFLREGKFVSA